LHARLGVHTQRYKHSPLSKRCAHNAVREGEPFCGDSGCCCPEPGFCGPLRRADLRPGKVLSCCRNEMVQQDQDKTRIHRKNKSEVPGFGTV
jgi:hypothetical protein